MCSTTTEPFFHWIKCEVFLLKCENIETGLNSSKRIQLHANPLFSAQFSREISISLRKCNFFKKLLAFRCDGKYWNCIHQLSRWHLKFVTSIAITPANKLFLGNISPFWEPLIKKKGDLFILLFVFLSDIGYLRALGIGKTSAPDPAQRLPY